MTKIHTPSQLVLASSSPHRKQLLERLQVPFNCQSPEIDESHRSGESPQELVERLAREKALKVALSYPQALIIGSDQVAVHEGDIVGKPKDHADAVKQLQQASGKAITLYTGLALVNSLTQHTQSMVEAYTVVFRSLSDHQIESYLEKDQPYNCAGSVKSESLGVALFERHQGDDPSTLIGLPLIQLVKMLEIEGYDVLGVSSKP